MKTAIRRPSSFSELGKTGRARMLDLVGTALVLIGLGGVGGFIVYKAIDPNIFHLWLK